MRAVACTIDRREQCEAMRVLIVHALGYAINRGPCCNQRIDIVQPED